MPVDAATHVGLPGPAPAGVARRRSRVTAWALPEVRWSLLATVLFGAGALAQLADAPAWLYWTLYLTCYAAGGWEPGLVGLKALRHKSLDVDLLMVAAAIGAAAIGQVFDGALLIVIFATSGALEAVATKRTEDSVRSLLRLTPETATRVLSDGAEEVVDAQALAVGDVLLIRPGERIGGDCVVIEGVSDVDQASITGESLPVDKAVGDEVFAGTLNGAGALRVRVVRPAADTVIARIVTLVAQASASKARTQLFIEKIEQRYSVAMVAATVALFVIPLLFGADLQSALLRAMTFMIVASPCALVLSTMPPLLAAIANAGRHGVLVKSAVVLEKLATVTRVAFDKTGTLTLGTPTLTTVRTVSGTRYDDAAVLAMAAAVERDSEHPLGRAIVAAARQRGLLAPGTTDFIATAGRGVSARLDGCRVQVGSPALLDDHDDAARVIVDDVERHGNSAVVVQIDGVSVAVLGLADHPRPGAAETVDRLARLTGTPSLLLTGDNARAAALLGEELGITDIRAGLLPEGKSTAVRQLQNDGARVMLVGDGINDAPAMAHAHVAVAMGRNGSDLTLETADAVITHDDLAAVPGVLTLARRARRVVIANLVIAATFIAVLVVWDLVGHLPLPLGVAGHEGSTVLVGLNGLRLLRDRAWPRFAPNESRVTARSCRVRSTPA
ncbi:putative cobalt/nickel-exporting P-type ATPase [Mycolicibacterium anyangense]|uniref:Putative cobalt/nickel-exporting P-type ATPase n=1 Tax=Mycolicibacterium anyangense TaxID=1431246 RepID=A0A6N4W1A8_9MYCO|nr:heavy metal translocating P-type ATPase [Mycolicibacterium anyangense]BBZ74749.1 putative cobalt/nickel-exporting P-type ATPase [Mycolicibacterium anyangense]